MKKKILAVFLSIITIIFISTYPYSYWFVQFGFWLSFSTFEQIIFPTKRAKILNENGFYLKLISVFRIKVYMEDMQLM